MAFCNVCGSELREGASFCRVCGAAVDGVVPQVPVNAQAPAAVQPPAAAQASTATQGNGRAPYQGAPQPNEGVDAQGGFAGQTDQAAQQSIGGQGGPQGPQGTAAQPGPQGFAAGQGPDTGAPGAPGSTPTPNTTTVSIDLGADMTSSFTPEDISNNKVFALATYLLGFIGIIVALLAAHTSPFAMFHAREATKLVVTQALIGLLMVLLCWTLIVPLLGLIAMIALGVVELICIWRVAKGEAKEAPVVGSLKFLK